MFLFEKVQKKCFYLKYFWARFILGGLNYYVLYHQTFL